MQAVVDNAHEILHSQVQDVIAQAKVKIEEIQREIESLNVEYHTITLQIEEVTASRKDAADKNRGLQEQLKGIKLHNESLAKRKIELTAELKRAKEDLSIMIEKGEQQKAIFIKEISIVKETERKLTEARDRERRQFEEVERANTKKI